MFNLLLSIFLFFSPADLPQGTQVILQAYTTESCQIIPFDSYQAAHVGERWKVAGTTVITTEGQTYRILSLEPRFEQNVPPIQWPESAVKIAFTGIK